MVNSRTKGAAGEREFAHALKELGIEARRGRQFSGSQDSPDVVTALTGIHFEVKRVEKLNLSTAMKQAEDDCGEKVPVVAHRRNREDWKLTFRLQDLERFLEAWKGTPDGQPGAATNTEGERDLEQEERDERD